MTIATARRQITTRKIACASMESVKRRTSVFTVVAFFARVVRVDFFERIDFFAVIESSFMKPNARCGFLEQLKCPFDGHP